MRPLQYERWWVAKLCASGCVVFAAALGACSGTAVFDAVDPEACVEGHGCPMAACFCADGSTVLDTTCEKGRCLAIPEVCRERCEPYGGPTNAFGTPSDVVAIPACTTFCDRVELNGCELGCATLFSECTEARTCDPVAASFWSCVVGRGKLSCDDLALRVEGCADEQPGLCSE